MSQVVKMREEMERHIRNAKEQRNVFAAMQLQAMPEKYWHEMVLCESMENGVQRFWIERKKDL